MDHLEPAPIRKAVDSTRLRAVPLPKLLGIAAAFAVFFWDVAVASAVVSFVLAVTLAIAWCLWLEKHPSTTHH